MLRGVVAALLASDSQVYGQNVAVHRTNDTSGFVDSLVDGLTEGIWHESVDTLVDELVDTAFKVLPARHGIIGKTSLVEHISKIWYTGLRHASLPRPFAKRSQRHSFWHEVVIARAFGHPPSSDETFHEDPRRGALVQHLGEGLAFLRGAREPRVQRVAGGHVNGVQVHMDVKLLSSGMSSYSERYAEIQGPGTSSVGVSIGAQTDCKVIPGVYVSCWWELPTELGPNLGFEVGLAIDGPFMGWYVASESEASGKPHSAIMKKV